MTDTRSLAVSIGLVTLFLVIPVHTADSRNSVYKDTEPDLYFSKQRPGYPKGGDVLDPYRGSTSVTSWTRPPPVTTAAPPANDVCATKLDFSRMGLTRLDESVIHSPGVVHLNVSDNSISHVSPRAFAKLPDLKSLDLSGNNIALGMLLQYSHLNSLLNLYVDRNNGTKDDNVIRKSGVFPRLERLYLRGNTIAVFDLELRNVAPSLTHLDLSNNGIKSNAPIAHLPYSLTHLTLDDNMIRDVNFISLVQYKIQELSMNRNKFEALCFNDCSEPNAIKVSSTASLRDLQLSGNKISQIQGTGQHSQCDGTQPAHRTFRTLFKLNLSHNKLNYVNNSVLCEIQRLHELSLSHNHFSSFPNICPLTNLHNLDLSYNEIEVIPTGCLCRNSHFRVLNLSNNRISNIQIGAFNTHSALHTLDLSNNKIIELPSGWVGPSTSIGTLRLTNNLISDFSRVCLTGMSSMRNLYIEENPMIYFKVESFANLTQLFVHIRLEKPMDDDAVETDENTTGDKSAKSWWV